jgi:hypothetical protein
MNKVSAQQIRSLETRIARLEREAGLKEIFNDIGGFVKGVVNIPKNFIKKIINVFKDVGNNLTVLLSKKEDSLVRALKSALGIRVAATLGNFIIDTRDVPVIVDFNLMNPIKSTFTGGNAGSSKVSLDKLASLYEGEQARRIKSAFLSWKSDYISALNALQGKDQVGLIKRFLKLVQRTSKLFYRFFKIVLSIFSVSQLLAAPWAHWMIGLAMVFMGSQGMLAISDDYLMLKDKSLATVFTSPKDFLPDLSSETANGVTKLGPGLITLVLKLLEKAFYRYGVNVDAFDEESMGRTASQFPRVASVTRRLEHYAYA